MKLLPKLVIATNNQNKFKEIEQLLSDIVKECIYFPHISVQETAFSYHENAKAKAISAAKAVGCICLSEDSGLEVRALGGVPGVFSSSFGGNIDDIQRNELILKLLFGKEDRSAEFICVVAVAFPDLQVYTFEGRCRGVIATQPLGNSGFGYDPIFIPACYNKTFAQLGTQIKNKISHRKHAIEKAKIFLQKLIVD